MGTVAECHILDEDAEISHNWALIRYGKIFVAPVSNNAHPPIASLIKGRKVIIYFVPDAHSKNEVFHLGGRTIHHVELDGSC